MSKQNIKMKVIQEVKVIMMPICKIKLINFILYIQHKVTKMYKIISQYPNLINKI